MTLQPTHKKIAIAAGAIVIILIAWYAYVQANRPVPTVERPTDTLLYAQNYKDTEYVIGGERVYMKNGFSSITQENSAAPIITQYFGAELRTDVNADGREDVVLVINQETGGTGSFYYVVTALNTEKGYIGGEGYFLGDRVGILPLTLDGNIIVAKVIDRKPGDSIATPPSVEKTVRLKFDAGAMMFSQVN